MTETELIERLTRRIPRRTPQLRLGIGDDASLIRAGKKDVIVTCDSLVENVHFRRRWGPWSLWGAKAAAAALSDVAAMGGRAKFAWLALQIPSGMKSSHIQNFFRGFQKTMRRFGAVVAGGNISRSPIFFSATTTVWGEVAAGRAMQRDRARPGERVYLSGKLGKSASRFQPRLALGEWLVAQRCRSAIDVSDGLLQDLLHIAQASKVKIILDAEKIPHTSRGGSFKKLLARGEDYELAFTTKKRLTQKTALQAGRTTFSEIGIVAAGKPQVVVLRNGKPLMFPKMGFQHKIA